MPKPKWLEPLEQTAHFWMGFGARLLYLDLLYWRREAVKQWPPATDREPVVHVKFFGSGDEREVGVQLREIKDYSPYCSLARAEDTLRDLHWMIVGATAAELVRWPIVGVLIWKFA